MIPHTYRDASEDPAAYAADQCGRQGVTVAFASEHLVDEPLYVFRAEAAEMGMDPWVSVEGIDALRDGSGFVVEFSRTGEIRAQAGDRLFAQRSTLRKLGLPDGEPGGWKLAGPR